MTGDQAVQLNGANWFLEEHKKTEAAINHIRKVLGTYRAEMDSTFNFLQGYLSGVHAMYNKFENVGFGEPK